jgi:hypothetical protein
MNAEIFHRVCKVTTGNGEASDLVVAFYAPTEAAEPGEFTASATIRCVYFDRTLTLIGEDAAQAFFGLPMVVTSYLIGQRRFGYEAYWLKPGDLDYTDFWTYKP